MSGCEVSALAPSKAALQAEFERGVLEGIAKQRSWPGPVAALLVAVIAFSAGAAFF